MTPLTLIGGPRHGQILDVKAGIKQIAIPVLSADRHWCYAAVYDGLSGQWIRDDMPTRQPAPPPMPTVVCAPRVSLRRRLGLWIAGLTEDDIGGEW